VPFQPGSPVSVVENTVLGSRFITAAQGTPAAGLFGSVAAGSQKPLLNRKLTRP
jgi:hypothetical protein